MDGRFGSVQGNGIWTCCINLRIVSDQSLGLHEISRAHVQKFQREKNVLNTSEKNIAIKFRDRKKIQKMKKFSQTQFKKNFLLHKNYLIFYSQR